MGHPTTGNVAHAAKGIATGQQPPEEVTVAGTANETTTSKCVSVPMNLDVRKPCGTESIWETLKALQ